MFRITTENLNDHFVKFNTKLKQELESCEKILFPKPTEVRRRKQHKESNPETILGKRGEKVVGSDIKWKPVDKTAALVVAKAPWWAKAPPETKPEKQSNQKPKSMSTIKGTPNAAINPTAQIVRYKTEDEMSELIAAQTVKATEKVIKSSSTELVDKAIDARAALDLMASSWQVSWMEFIENSDKRINSMRQTRMAFDVETRQLMASLREVRQFFLDKDYATEIARLKEFVDTCERLQKLKESGFLDSVADTMLRLSETKNNQ